MNVEKQPTSNSKSPLLKRICAPLEEWLRARRLRLELERTLREIEAEIERITATREGRET